MSKIINTNEKQKGSPRNSAPSISISDSFLTNLVAVLVGLAVVISLRQVFQLLEKYSFTSLAVLLEEVLPRTLSWEFWGNLTIWVAFVLWCGAYLVWSRAAGNNPQLRANLSKLSYAKKLAFLGVNLGALLGLTFMAYFVFKLAGFILAFAWFNTMHWACLYLMKGRAGRVQLATDDTEVLANSFDFWFRYTYIYQILSLNLLVVTGFFASQGLLKVVWGFLLIARVVLEFKRNEQFYTGKPAREGAGNVLVFTR